MKETEREAQEGRRAPRQQVAAQPGEMAAGNQAFARLARAARLDRDDAPAAPSAAPGPAAPGAPAKEEEPSWGPKNLYEDDPATKRMVVDAAKLAPPATAQHGELVEHFAYGNGAKKVWKVTDMKLVNVAAAGGHPSFFTARNRAQLPTMLALQDRLKQQTNGFTASGEVSQDVRVASSLPSANPLGEFDCTWEGTLKARVKEAAPAQAPAGSPPTPQPAGGPGPPAPPAPGTKPPGAASTDLDPHVEFEFDGVMYWHDYWNFDSKSWGSRPFFAELFTRTAGGMLPGTPFHIETDKVPFREVMGRPPAW